jgi:putative hemolysin
MQRARVAFGLSAPSAPLLARWASLGLERLLGLAALRRAQAAIERSSGGKPDDLDAWLAAANQWLGLDVDLPAGDRERIPASGGIIVAADHPTGAMEGLLLLTVLRERRRDVLVLANRRLACIPALASSILLVDVFRRDNTSAARRALRHLASGGLLLVFPAGAVATGGLLRTHASEARWQASFAALQRRAGVPVLPIHVRAHNPRWLDVLGRTSAHLRTALLPRALLAQRRAAVAVRIGHPILAEQLERFGRDDIARSDYLRLRTRILLRRADGSSVAVPHRRPHVPVAERGDATALAAEIAGLAPAALVCEGNGMQVFGVEAAAIPLALAEIGRLRELTFRAVGEGSGQPRDIDRFDATYRHLFVWSPREREIVGAYRLGAADQLFGRGGATAFYGSSFYRFAPEFWQRTWPALELGRSFVQPRYQRAYAPLMLLWRGIGAYVANTARHRFLFGTVSISADHHATSVELMVDHLRSHCLATDLAPFVRSRRPWRDRSAGRCRHWQPAQIAELQDVSAMVRELEVGRPGVPILLEQYLKLGAKLLGINVDLAFHTIDALVVVDLLAVPEPQLRRYFGEPGVALVRGWRRDQAAPGVVASVG